MNKNDFTFSMVEEKNQEGYYFIYIKITGNSNFKIHK